VCALSVLAQAGTGGLGYGGAGLGYGGLGLGKGGVGLGYGGLGYGGFGAGLGKGAGLGVPITQYGFIGGGSGKGGAGLGYGGLGLGKGAGLGLGLGLGLGYGGFGGGLGKGGAGFGYGGFEGGPGGKHGGPGFGGPGGPGGKHGHGGVGFIAAQAPPIYNTPIMNQPIVSPYPVPQIQTINQAVPYEVEQPVIQPYIQPIRRQAVPVLEQQINAIPVPVVHQVQVPGPVQTIEEEAPAAQPIMTQPVTKGTTAPATIVQPITTTKGTFSGGTTLSQPILGSNFNQGFNTLNLNQGRMFAGGASPVLGGAEPEEEGEFEPMGMGGMGMGGMGMLGGGPMGAGMMGMPNDFGF